MRSLPTMSSAVVGNHFLCLINLTSSRKSVVEQERPSYDIGSIEGLDQPVLHLRASLPMTNRHCPVDQKILRLGFEVYHRCASIESSRGISPFRHSSRLGVQSERHKICTNTYDTSHLRGLIFSRSRCLVTAMDIILSLQALGLRKTSQ